jgi:GNAT superfamily N-acetyltransferase
MIRLERVVAALPADLEALRAEARAEGYGMLDTLAAQWASGANRFDQPGEMLLAAYADEVLAGIGGLTVETALPGTFRMRRFYIRRRFRRGGIGRQLALIVLEQRGGHPVTCNAASGSEAFWGALGFVPDRRDGYTHTHILV